MKKNIFACMAGILLCFFALKYCDAKDIPLHEQNNTKQPRIFNRNAEAIQKKFQREKIHFDKVADSLKTENENLYCELQTVRKLLKQRQSVVNKNLPCDTLRKELLGLNALTNEQDSLCELNIMSINQAVAVRDSELVLCGKNFQSMYDVQKENLQRQLQLAEDLKRVLKANRKKRFENKFLSCGLMIMTGITTTLFIKSQQQ